MRAYTEQRQAKRQCRGKPRIHPAISAQQAAWRSRLEEVRSQHRRQRWAAYASGRAWRPVWQAHRKQQAAWRQLAPDEKRQQQAEHAAQEATFHQQHLARQTERAAERAADQEWRTQRQTLLAEEAQLKTTPLPVPLWIAILVVIDNCTRRCLGLASFAAGVHLTAESLVAALGPLLPAGLQFVISDNGLLFCSKPFAALAGAAKFVHVRIAPYRPRTNGIAERFVRTLKDGLQEHAWSGPDDLPAILTQVRQAYDERPHQGRELQGLSPNEYQRRLLLGATC